MVLAQIPKALKMLKTGQGARMNTAGSRAVAQSRAMSLAEAVTNVIVGYAIAVATQTMILPLFDVHLSLGDNLLVGGVFTLVSIVRSYLLRRAFQYLQLR
jgi:hypothetical protein